ncbi:hypothetical protein Tco_1119613 [Tanacetum coccineum]
MLASSSCFLASLSSSIRTSGSIMIALPLSLIIEGCDSCGVLNLLGSCTGTPLALGLVVVVVAAVVTTLGLAALI